MLAMRSIQLAQDIRVTQRGSVATDHLAAFMIDTYTVFVGAQLLVHVPPPTKFDPFTKEEELDRGQGTALVSIDNYNEVRQLYDVACLKLAVARLLDERVSVI
ncbi:hypothetical protein JCGZ_14880 [Jatropha curcas]|uniref:Uncharacterized protein n=1 Tax=Jatropha curcas TaxID=180498 RepID=A0A067K852_JATCU|nr:hypothetical protein JCGZ_14880 [Jatropha curcas]